MRHAMTDRGDPMETTVLVDEGQQCLERLLVTAVHQRSLVSLAINVETHSRLG
jgi:hypothetical protein